MDEPLSNLDAKQRVTMRSEIAQIHRETGATTIYVTHDQVEAMTLANRIVIMKDGTIQQVGTPYELYFKPCNLFVAGFIGEPPMNFLPVAVKSGKISIASSILDLNDIGFDSTAYEGKDIILGFRPEGIRISESAVGISVASSVELTEMLGDVANVYVTMGDSNAVLKVDPHDTPEMNASFTFVIPYSSIYLFDAETEQVIFTPEIKEDAAC